MVAHHFHVTLLPLGTLAGINVRLARERTGRTHKRTQPRVEQYQFLMSWPKLALPSMTAVVRKAVLPVKSSPPAVTTCAARKPEFRRLSLHCFFLFTHIETCACSSTNTPASSAFDHAKSKCIAAFAATHTSSYHHEAGRQTDGTQRKLLQAQVAAGDNTLMCRCSRSA